MSEILITLPLKIFEGEQPLTADGVRTMLEEAVRAKDRVEQLEGRIENLRTVIRQYGLSLQAALDNSPNEFEKARALRQLVENMRNYG
jgi:DNA repair ATPase RecN